MEAFESGFQGSYEADLALIIINLKGLGIKNEVIARPPFDFYLARKSSFWSNFEYHYVFWCLAYISNCTLYGWPSWEPKSANRNLVKTPITTISSDECLTSYGDTSVLVDKICTKKINDQECPVSLEKDQNEIKKSNTRLRFQRDQSTLLVCHDVFEIEKKYLVGISVSGPDYCGFEQIPALFTSVLKHYKWINETISKHFDEWMY